MLFDATFVRFIVVGVINTAVGYALILILFHLVGFSYHISYLISYIFGFILSFFLNRRFVFFSQQSQLKEFLKFTLAFLFSYLASYALLFAMIESALLPTNIAFLLSMGLYSLLFYLLNRIVTFSSSS
jgi:putative flippase GtrA